MSAPWGAVQDIGTKKGGLVFETPCKAWRRPTFPRTGAVSSAMRGLTSLFGMGRGVHPLYSHQKHSSGTLAQDTRGNHTESLRVISTARL